MSKKLVFITCALCMGMTIFAQTEADFTVRRTADGKGIEIVEYTGSNKDVRIPPQIQGLPVTSIGKGAFMNNQLTGVTIPNNVTSIGHESFFGNQLTSVTIPNSVTSIGAGAFCENNLTSVTIPNSVTSIGMIAFANNQLTSVTIGNSVTFIEQMAFAGNQLTSITIGADVRFFAVSDPAFGHGFEAAYHNGGRRAGTYTRPNTDSTTWTRQ